MESSHLVSDTSSGGMHVKYAADKKYKPSAAFDALVASSSAGPAPAAPALAATSKNVELHNAAQAQVVSSSSSSYSAATSERHRRLLYANAKAERELAEARVRETRAEARMLAPSDVCMTFVVTEGILSTRDGVTTRQLLPTTATRQPTSSQQPTEATTTTNKSRCVASKEERTRFCPVLLPRKRDHLRALTLLLVRSVSHHRNLHLRPKQPPHQQPYVLQQNILNEGCNFGTALANSRQDTHIAVEQVIYAAEGLHSQAMANMAEQAQWDHQQQMVRVVQEAQEALARQ